MVVNRSKTNKDLKLADRTVMTKRYTLKITTKHMINMINKERRHSMDAKPTLNILYGIYLK
jgi:hypothetical protein